MVFVIAQMVQMNLLNYVEILLVDSVLVKCSSARITYALITLWFVMVKMTAVISSRLFYLNFICTFFLIFENYIYSSDESKLCNINECLNDPCEDRCIDLPISFKCDCEPPRVLSKYDNRSCLRKSKYYVFTRCYI